ncbi:u11/u12 small nuclear ribonucleoprotein 48 kda protein [Quercus suber]|uniref:U11/u12 small nuclear ribonucleoprotein 48 kDa protein n=1 Tax=Quercus suber TaxID=58331 RepID=A0AAW0KV89_QUESU
MNPNSLLTTLENLIHFSQQTLRHSLSLSISTTPHSENQNLIQCPFNPHHLIPSSALFRHSLRCHCSSSSSSNFFYHDCPAVVHFSTLHTPTPTATPLPAFLSLHSPNNPFPIDFDFDFSILPSDLLSIRAETDAWTDYPTAYSHAILRSLSLSLPGLIGNWVIMSSPRYGSIVIDVAMRDHILLLFRLCLNTIVEEALHNYSQQQSNEQSVMSFFKCPVLVQALMWLASQLSILYGEMNGKLFAIHMLKQCVLEAAQLGLFITTQTQSHAHAHAGRGDEVISVSQVQAAVTALKERAMLQQNFNGFHVSQPLTKYQLYETNKTKTREELLAEERDYKRRRMSYRGKKGKKTAVQVTRDIIDEYMEEIKKAGGIGCLVKGTEDQGMFPSESSSAHDSTITVDEPRKSDYAAPRGSQYNYRAHSNSEYGKRSNSLKDASLNEHHEYVNQRFSNRNKRDREIYSRSPSRNDSTITVDEPRKSGYAAARGSQYNDRTQSHSDCGKRSKSLKDASLDEHHEYVDQRCSHRDKHDSEIYSRSPSRNDSHRRSHVRSSHRRERDDLEVSNIRHHEIKQPSSGMLKYHYSRSSSSRSNSVDDSVAKKDEQKSNVEDRRGRKTYENHSSDFLEQNAFEDRYIPSESHDMSDFLKFREE